MKTDIVKGVNIVSCNLLKKKQKKKPHLDATYK